MLAVSGGLDSMVLLDAASKARERRDCNLIVATFDHASGPHSAKAAGFVSRASTAHGLAVVVGRAPGAEYTEAAWRAARWEFLHGVARRANAPVLTAHTCNDQIETVLMRVMRRSGARGLAGLRNTETVRRPFLDLTRREIQAYALAHRVLWTEDPTNTSRQHLRNRVRLDLLPALRSVHPQIDPELLSISERATAWRAELATLVNSRIRLSVTRDEGREVLVVDAEDLADLGANELAILWPELASRVGAVLDHRGTRRAADFTTSGRVGSRVQLSGGWELFRSRSAFELERRDRPNPVADGVRVLDPPMTWDRWSFARSTEPSRADSWRAALPNDRGLRIRAWQPGDRLIVRNGDRLISRKVKYFLSDAGISGHIRARWPVVLAGDEIVWIPGVRRSDAATVRSGGPVVIYVCDYLDRRS